MSALLVLLMASAVLAAVLYPLFAHAHYRRAASVERAVGEEQTGYLSLKELDLDYSSGKLDRATYERLASARQSAGTVKDDIEAEILRRRARRTRGIRR